MRNSAPATRYPSCRAPQLRTRKDETYDAARLRFRRMWAAYRDACVINECTYQASVCTSARQRMFFRAFYGVEGEYLIGVL